MPIKTPRNDDIIPMKVFVYTLFYILLVIVTTGIFAQIYSLIDPRGFDGPLEWMLALISVTSLSLSIIYYQFGNYKNKQTSRKIDSIYNKLSDIEVLINESTNENQKQALKEVHNNHYSLFTIIKRDKK